MAHEHIIQDSNVRFVINPTTRAITYGSNNITLVQNDHDSERFTFEIPREVEGHDMLKCNVVEIHYLNIEATTNETSAGLYAVDDLQISATDDKAVICSWLISNNATKYVGSLNFIVRFACVAADGTVEYNWSTTVFSGVNVVEGIFNSNVIAEANPDIIGQWEARISALEAGGGSAQPDLTQNDETAPDYVKGRTHWSEYADTTLIDGTYAIAELEEQPFPFTLNVGQTYKVIWNGVEYIETAQPDPIGIGMAVIGNMGLFGGENTEQPFTLYYNSMYGGTIISDMSGGSDENVTISILTNEETVHKIPDKYVPFAMPFYVEGMVTQSGVECLASFENIKVAFDKGYYICLKLMNEMMAYYIFPLSAFWKETRTASFEGFIDRFKTTITMTWDNDGNCNAELVTN